MSSGEQPPGSFHKFVYHPITQFIFGGCTVTAFLWIFIGREVREFTVSVNPVRTTIIKAGESSQLKVTYRGMELSNDVNAVQIAIWNAGKRPIRHDEIRAPISISIANVRILEATIRHVSTDVTHVSIDDSDLYFGRVGVSWDTFEKGEGASLQIIYAGSPTANISFQGVILEQSKIKVVGGSAEKVPWILLWFGVAFGLGLTGGVLWIAVNYGFDKAAITMLGLSLMYWGVIGWSIWQNLSGPPFAF